MATATTETKFIGDTPTYGKFDGLSGVDTSYTMAITMISFKLYQMIENYSAEQMNLATSVQQEQTDKAKQMLKDMGAYDAPGDFNGKNFYDAAPDDMKAAVARYIFDGAYGTLPQDPIQMINLIMAMGLTDQGAISNMISQQTNRLNNLNSQFNSMNTVFSSLSQQVTDDVSRTSQTLSTLLDMIGNKGIVALMQVITQMLGR